MKRPATPKRRTPLAPVSKDPSRRKRTKARRDHQYGRDERGDFAAFVRAHPCLGWSYLGGGCEGPNEACHIQGRGAHPEVHGVGNLWPGCSYHHQHQYRIPMEVRQAYAAKLAAEWEDDHAE